MMMLERVETDDPYAPLCMGGLDQSRSRSAISWRWAGLPGQASFESTLSDKAEGLAQSRGR